MSGGGVRHKFSAMHRFFTYGTLKSGEPNFFRMTDPKYGKAVFVSKATTVRRFPLLIASRYNAPYLLYKPGTGHRIVGEVYDVDDALLKYLDDFEMHPTYYLRQEEDVEFEDGTIHKAWLYSMIDFKDDLMEGKELYADYHSDGPHGTPYVPRHMREANSAEMQFKDVKSK